MPKRTPLYENHVRLGARIVPFAGFDMPVQYAGVVAEHRAVRAKAGLFDVSHMGEFEFTGSEAGELLNHLTANDVGKLTPGKAQYSLLLNNRGGIVDDILIYALAPEKFWMVVNAANIEKDWIWIAAHCANFPSVEIRNISDATALIAFQGPEAIPFAKQITSLPLEMLKSFHFAAGTFAGQPDVLTARTGYTGEDGTEIFCRAQQAPAIWEACLKTGATPCGLGARDTLRLEARLSLYGHEINDETNPFEAGLGWVVKMEKKDFIGKSALEKIREAGLKRKLAGFAMVDKGIPREGCPLVLLDGTPAGRVTSGTFSPTLERAIGLGWLPVQEAAVGTKFNVDIRGKLKLAEVVAVPFFKRK